MSYDAEYASALPEANETDYHNHYVKMSGLSVGTAILRNFYPPLTIVSIVLFTYTAIPYLRQSESSLLKNNKVDGYVLYAVADMMMLWLGAYVTAALGVGLLHAAKFILSNAKDKSKQLVVDAFAKRPDQVWISRDGVELQVPFDSLVKADTVIVHTGEVIPVDGKSVLLGSRRFMEMSDTKISKEMDEAMDEAHSNGHSAIIVAIDAKARAILEMHTRPRPELTKVLVQLRTMGVAEMMIVSGDHEKPSCGLARALGMDGCFYDVLPDQKADIVEKLQKEGKKVAFVGDGVNDVIAMKKADVSISLKGATTIATDVAQIIMMDGTLTHLPYLCQLSSSLNKNLSRSLAINIVPSAVTLSGVLFFHFGMLTAVLVSQSPLFFGAANAVLPLKQTRRDIGKR